MGMPWDAEGLWCRSGIRLIDRYHLDGEKQGRGCAMHPAITPVQSTVSALHSMAHHPRSFFLFFFCQT